MLKQPMCLDGQIHANRFSDSRASPDSHESFQGSRTESQEGCGCLEEGCPGLPRVSHPRPLKNPFLCESRFGGLTIANREFEAIRANRSHVLKKWVCFCESIRAKRPDSRCESPGHLSPLGFFFERLRRFFREVRNGEKPPHPLAT